MICFVKRRKGWTFFLGGSGKNESFDKYIAPVYIIPYVAVVPGKAWKQQYHKSDQPWNRYYYTQPTG